jgi:hypothetical protein
MKTLKQIKEQAKPVVNEDFKPLIDAGLLEENQIPLLKRALNQDPNHMTVAERKSLIGTLDSILEGFNVRYQNPDHLAAYPKDISSKAPRNIPMIIILKRKAIRVFPDNQTVALYYTQALDKYVSVPFSGPTGKALGMYVNEETEEIKEEEEIIMAEAKDPKDIFRKHLNEARQEQLDEVLPVIAGAVAGTVARAGLSLGKRLVQKGISKWRGKGKSKVPFGGRRRIGVGKNNADNQGADGGGESNSAKYRETETGEFTQAGRAKPTVSAAGRASSDLTGAHIERQRNKVAWQMEENFKVIKKLAESTGDPTVINFGKETITINNRIASKVMKVYEQLNKENKQKLKSMLGESTETFRKAINFVVRQG